MNKTVTLHNFENNLKEVVIKNFEDVSYITCLLITGDELLLVTYKNNEQILFDSSEDRLMSYFDDIVNIPLDRIDELSELSSSEVIRHFR